MSDIGRLFAEDPLNLTKDGPELELIIKRYREAAAQFKLGLTAAGATKRVAPPPGPKLKIVDLDDLLGSKP